MKFTYDRRYNVGYISFKKKQNDAESVRVSDELVVDLAPDGTVYGIELLNANEQLKCEDTGELVVINEETEQGSKLATTKRKPAKTRRISEPRMRKKKPSL
jgi:uncharacterized protein YuzE